MNIISKNNDAVHDGMIILYDSMEIIISYTKQFVFLSVRAIFQDERTAEVVFS